ncbi:citryl-CoA lyase [Candidatus Heimdallarchaeota archaeon B3_Heim]|nr:MAG: citryl-CoA lyase [Candidatus Heimdallarchaeota archaeon B3_Heim]
MWETKITKVSPNELLIRGYPLDELIGSISYAAGIYLALKGDLPTKQEERVINAILVATMDHGVTAPSAVAARTVASCGVPITTAMGAGILAVGDHHGGAGEKCIKFLKKAFEYQENDQSLSELAKNVVTQAKKKKQRIPGFGHRFHTDDPRTKKLLQVALDEGISGMFVELAKLIASELSTQSNRPLPLNVDGAIGALLADMGFKAQIGKAFFAIARVTGLTAHILEEYSQRPVRTIIPSDAKYTGEEKRQIP